MGPRQKLIREILRANDNGLTVEQLSQAADVGLSRAYRIINEMPDAYIDRWIKKGHTTTAVWCVVIPPPHCPRPTSQRNK
jgi:predicted DNA-binding transcriptional regulator YafY